MSQDTSDPRYVVGSVAFGTYDPAAAMRNRIPPVAETKPGREPEEMNTPQRKAFWKWLPLAYRDGDQGQAAKFTKWNMEVAHLAGWEAAFAASPAVPAPAGNGVREAVNTEDRLHRFAVTSSNYNRPFLVGCYETLEQALLAQDGKPERWEIFERVAAPAALATPVSAEEDGLRAAEAKGFARAIAIVEKHSDQHCREFGVYDYSTNVVEFSGAAEDVDGAYQDLLTDLNAALASQPTSVGDKLPSWVRCCERCNRLVDTREKDEGGDQHGCQLEDGTWACSIDCYEALTPTPAESARVASQFREALATAKAAVARHSAQPAESASSGGMVAAVGWAYRESKWGDPARWHLCSDKPSERPGRDVQAVYPASTIEALQRERDEAVETVERTREFLTDAQHRAGDNMGRALKAGKAVSAQNEEVSQILGKALGYPWFKDDQANFPGSTEEHGVCVGDHVAASLADEAAKRLAELEGSLAQERSKREEAVEDERDRLYELSTQDDGVALAITLLRRQGAKLPAERAAARAARGEQT